MKFQDVKSILITEFISPEELMRRYPNSKEARTMTHSSPSITRKDLDRAIDLINKVPASIVKAHIRDEEELDEFKKVRLASEIGINNVYGFPVYTDKNMNENEIKFSFSDGHTEIIKIYNKK